MSAFGYGSSYSFKTGELNPGQSGLNFGSTDQRMGMPMSQGMNGIQKGGLSSGSAQQSVSPMLPPKSAPAMPYNDKADPYNMSFGSDINVNMDMTPFYGQDFQDNNSYQARNSFGGIRRAHDTSGFQNSAAAQLAHSVMPNYAYGYNKNPDAFNASTYAPADLANNYQQAYDMLNRGRSELSAGILTQNPTDGDGHYMNSMYDTSINNLQGQYKDWIQQMMRSGAYGFGGSTSYGGY